MKIEKITQVCYNETIVVAYILIAPLASAAMQPITVHLELQMQHPKLPFVHDIAVQLYEYEVKQYYIWDYDGNNAFIL